jgi:hypothetical protein
MQPPEAGVFEIVRFPLAAASPADGSGGVFSAWRIGFPSGEAPARLRAHSPCLSAFTLSGFSPYLP